METRKPKTGFLMFEDVKMKEKIIDAAIAEFTEHGLKFTMNDVASRLGISKKTIYTVFDSKQAVLNAIGDRYATDLRSMQQEIEADDSLDITEKIERLLLALPNRYYNIGLSGIYDLAGKYPKTYRHLMKAVNQGWKLVEQYLEEGIRQNKIQNVPIPVVMAMVEGTVQKFLTSNVLVQNHMTYEQGKEEMIAIIMKGIKRSEV